MGLLTSLRAKLEITRLERRYTRRRDKRTTFTSSAQYLDGEYVYPSFSPSAAAPTAYPARYSYATPSPAAESGYYASSSLPHAARRPASRASERRARHDGAAGRGVEPSGEFGSLWAKSKARMPSVRVAEVFGGGGGDRGSRGDWRDGTEREGGVREFVEGRRRERDDEAEEWGGSGQW